MSDKFEEENKFRIETATTEQFSESLLLAVRTFQMKFI